MRIHEIITENDDAVQNQEKYRQLVQRNPELARRMLPYISQGYDWDTSSEIARDEMERSHSGQSGGRYPVGKDDQKSRDDHYQDRSRRDSRGRRLRHDRYYGGGDGRTAADAVRKGASAIAGKDAAQGLSGVGAALGSLGGAASNFGKNRLRRAADRLRKDK